MLCYGTIKEYASSAYICDNKWILKEKFVLDNYRANHIIFNNNYIYYSHSAKRILKVNNVDK